MRLNRAPLGLLVLALGCNGGGSSSSSPAKAALNRGGAAAAGSTVRPTGKTVSAHQRLPGGTSALRIHRSRQ
jgi:hypothetical protein